MKDPIGAFQEAQESIKRYITSAFGTSSRSFEEDRKRLLDTEGVLFQHPFVEPLPMYKAGLAPEALSEDDLPAMSSAARGAFISLIRSGLFEGDFPLYLHQQRMLREALLGKHCVVVTGTGSGKTESFLLPVLASIIREAHRDKGSWEPPRNASGDKLWSKTRLPDWNDSRRAIRGESRHAAVRALLLYPMNALVEDQVSRLRAALDTDKALAVMDANLGGNRLRFGRYNGTTPVSGHPLKPDGSANSNARRRLADSLRKFASEYQMVRAREQELIASLRDAEARGDAKLVPSIKTELEKVSEQLTFLPRFDLNASEMIHRWEMQSAPPDILITNVSMLSIMLMRHASPQLPGDQADADIFESTRSWLSADPQNKFQLVIDELHLYRGASGTEVAYLIRLLLNRLGLSPTSNQFQILASSASLDGESRSTFEFLGGFFGLTPEEASEAFHVEAGESVFPPHGCVAELSSELQSAAWRARQNASADADFDLVSRLKSESNIERKVYAAFQKDDGGVRAARLADVSAKWFTKIAEDDRPKVTQEFLKALGESSRDLATLPRLRFHWMAKNIDGLWATPALSTSDVHRRVGDLLPEPKDTYRQKRVLEVLYCECCGTQFLCGNKIRLTSAQVGGAPNPHAVPGVGGGGADCFELTAMVSRLDGLPEKFSEIRTDSKPYHEIGVIWLVADEWKMASPLDYGWRQGSVERTERGKPVRTEDACWKPARFNPYTGICSMGSGGRLPDELSCLWLDVNEKPAPDEANDWVLIGGMPQRCPACLIDYSERAGGRFAPVRSFVTGLSRTSHLLTKHLMGVLGSKQARKLVAFADSRESAANLAVGVEREQWSHLLRVFIFSELKKRVVGVDAEAKRLLALGRAEGVAAARDALVALRKHLSEDEFEKLRDIFNLLRDQLEHGDDFLSDASRERLRRLEGTGVGYVQVDNLFTPPDIHSPLPEVWKDLVSEGVCPAGAGVDDRSVGSRSRPKDWTSLFQNIEGEIQPKFKHPMSDAEAQQVDVLSMRLRKSAWRAISGRLLYDLEAQGLGHLAIHPDSVREGGAGLPRQRLIEVCDSVIRILTEEKRTDPTQREWPAEGWRDTEPTGDSREGIAKRRVFRFLSAVAELNRCPYDALRAAVQGALVRAGHHASGGWAVVTMSNLWIRVVEPEERPWVCSRCTQLHWHHSGGVCSRCCASLPAERDQTRIANEESKKHYNAYEATKAGAAFRIHAEELTGQTIDQAQRQRHFRDVFFADEDLNEIGQRKALKNVDSIDLLAVTTTMEVGVDIGALQAVFQANMPPERFNYQQRAGRAGRKGQAFSAVLTYCRGQTHDRVHFEHPDEMTGGVPPQPSVSVGDDQMILAERLLAKEILRRAFISLGLTWADSGAPPDTHGEFGIIDSGVQARIDSVECWIQSNAQELENVAKVVSRGTKISPGKLIDSGLSLPERMRESLRNGVVDGGLGEHLAESGILPMYGMPTTVRNLYFRLPVERHAEAQSLDRNLNQAITDFAPGSERTWDKRKLTSIGICGRISRSPKTSRWESDQPVVGSAFAHLFCRDCRQLQHAKVDPVDFSPRLRADWWEKEWAERPPVGGVECPACKGRNAQPYLAIVPRAFITDLNCEVPAGVVGGKTGSKATAFVASPVLGGNVGYSRIGNGSIALGRQAAVYKVNDNAGSLYGFSEQTNGLRGSNNEWLNSSFLRADHSVGPDGLAYRAALTSPKTTDMLAVRAANHAGLAFFDYRPAISSRKAAWYSAATILQRAIALELDIDSLDIEIASVHRFSELTGAQGVELYLADEHPNGAGIVSWAHDNWLPLLEGILSGTGGFSRMGAAIKAELFRQQVEEWRSPDVLLKGFRNRQLHGLIDWRLGMDLLGVLLSNAFKPGLHNAVKTSKGAEGIELPDWTEKAKNLAAIYLQAFPSAATALGESLPFAGWQERSEPTVVTVVTHPLWDQFAGDNNQLEAILQWAADNGRSHVRLVDSFNLTRRVAWVRGNLIEFPLVEVPKASGNPSGSGAPGRRDSSVLNDQEVVELASGKAFEYLGGKWIRVATHPVVEGEAGTFLVVDEHGHVGALRAMKGVGSNKTTYISPTLGGRVEKDRLPSLRVIAKSAG